MDVSIFNARVSLWAALAAVVFLALSGCAHEPVTEIGWVLDESEGCLPPDLDALTAAEATWDTRSIAIRPGGFGHQVTVCFVALVPYDAPAGWRAVGRVFRDDDGTRMYIEAGRSPVQTAETVTHEFGHVVTWSSDHAEGHGILGVMAEGSEFSPTDLEHLASFGL